MLKGPVFKTRVGVFLSELVPSPNLPSGMLIPYLLEQFEHIPMHKASHHIDRKK